MDATTPRDLDQLDSEALKALILALREQVFSHRKQLTTQQEEILSQREQLASRDAEIEHLKLLIAKLRRLQFGRSSEKREYQIEQLELRLEELEARRTQETTAVKESAPPSTAVVRPVRRPLPDHLPREVRKYLPKQEACPDCGGKLKHLGEDVSEILEYVPASLKVIQYIRPKLACACCDRIVQAEAPSRPIERSIAGPGLLAHVLVSKYCDHLPLYRQSQIYARAGVELDRSTMAEWVGGSSRLLAPLVEALRRHVMAAGKLHADDTPVPVLAPGLGKTKTGRLWTYVRDDRRARKSIAAPFWFCPTLVPTPELACHPRVVFPRPSRGAATPPPVARAAGWIRQPTPPGLSDPTPRLCEQRSATDDTEASDRSISIPAHAPEALVPQCLARSVGSALRLARCDRNTRKPSWGECIG